MTGCPGQWSPRPALLAGCVLLVLLTSACRTYPPAVTRPSSSHTPPRGSTAPRIAAGADASTAGARHAQPTSKSPMPQTPASESATADAIRLLSGAKLISDEDEPAFLGRIGDAYESDSIFNEYGTHGSEYSSESIWNEYARYGGKFSLYSAFNDIAQHPPLIIKDGRVIGRLTVNDLLPGAINPWVLKAIFGD